MNCIYNADADDRRGSCEREKSQAGGTFVGIRRLVEVGDMCLVSWTAVPKGAATYRLRIWWTQRTEITQLSVDHVQHSVASVSSVSRETSGATDRLISTLLLPTPPSIHNATSFMRTSNPNHQLLPGRGQRLDGSVEFLVELYLVCQLKSVQLLRKFRLLT